ncbi:MAG: putative AAA family ATPase [Edafosvirus sp.]|uniref:Putative AAA family ATPase n=1 Tax=Edafosvirus sp. TaxID=2487765 RepID=A0A3G4ZUC2_9VIRU|nr:MAG: putative AAA family ATPase [Edafosvirus sp.]
MQGQSKVKFEIDDILGANKTSKSCCQINNETKISFINNIEKGLFSALSYERPILKSIKFLIKKDEKYEKSFFGNTEYKFNETELIKEYKNDGVIFLDPNYKYHNNKCIINLLSYEIDDEYEKNILKEAMEEEKLKKEAEEILKKEADKKKEAEETKKRQIEEKKKSNSWTNVVKNKPQEKIIVKTVEEKKIEEKKVEEKKEKKDYWHHHGIINDKTNILFEYEADIKIIKDASAEQFEISEKDLKELAKKLEEKGLGGAEEYIQTIIRDVFLSRTKLANPKMKKFLKPARGIMLYGPPGTGKTTLARCLAQIFGCTEDRFKMITATEIMDKYVGESEKNIRELFEPAREASKKLGDKSPLYIIVVDEIDAILRTRGLSLSSWRDGLVNQFLGEMDGLNQLNNILVIGMTNCIELVDSAALRPGRFGCKIEIDLPKEGQRKSIFDVYINKFKEDDVFTKDIDTKELAKISDKFSGADIESVITTCFNNILQDQLRGIDSKISMKNLVAVIDEIMKGKKKLNRKTKGIKSITDLTEGGPMFVDKYIE